MAVEPDIATACKRIEAALKVARSRIGEKAGGEYMLQKFMDDTNDAFKFIERELGEARTDLHNRDDAENPTPAPPPVRAKVRKKYPKLNSEEDE